MYITYPTDQDRSHCGSQHVRCGSEGVTKRALNKYC